jgi:hypothetical protein
MNPVPYKQQSICPFALNDKEGCKQPLVSKGSPAKSFRTILVGIKSPGPMPSFLNAVYDITLTAAPPSTNILVNGFPLTYPLKYSGLMCRFLAGLSKVPCLANTSCAISPNCSASSMFGDTSSYTIWLAGAMNSFGKKHTMHVGAERPDPSGLSFGRHTCFLSIPACFNSWFLKRWTPVFWLLLKPGGHHCPFHQTY